MMLFLDCSSDARPVAPWHSFKDTFKTPRIMANNQGGKDGCEEICPASSSHSHSDTQFIQPNRTADSS
jgi:hypothetical protein